MRLMLLNPNSTDAITAVMAEEARRAASPDTDIRAVTARFGTLYVENRVEAAVAGHAVVDAVAEHVADCDAVVIAAFGDPGLGAAKEMADVPVVGITEAALLTAWTLGRRFSIVCMTTRLRTWYAESAAEHGLAARLASVRALDVPVPDVTRAKTDLAGPLAALCRRAVEEDEAEVVILGGGPVAGLARGIAGEVPVPLLDGVACGVRMAEMLVALEVRAPSRGSFARPAGKPATGLSDALARYLAGDGGTGPATP